MRDVSDIASYHAHVYFDPSQRDAAMHVREAVSERFVVELGRVHEGPFGPHTKASYQIAFATDVFAAIVPWLMLNRSGLSILVHPRTGNEIEDHEKLPLWLGEPLPIDLEFLRQHG